eukprot:s1473_g5.t1
MTIPAATSATSASQWSCGANLIPQTPKDAFHALQMGNSRSVKGVRRFPAPATGPFATIVACTDCPRAAEAIFDAQPGSLFVTTLHGCYGCSEGLLKNLELSTELGSKFILVMGHKQCMALLRASEQFFADGEPQFPTLRQAAEDMGPWADAGFVCERAMTLNVIQTIQFLLASSGRLRERVKNGKLEIHGGMLDPFSGVVHFMGPVPGQAKFLKDTSGPTEAEVETGATETAETSETAICEKAIFLPPFEAVEKAGDSQASQETGTEGTGPGTDCGQSDPASSWSTDVLRRESKDSSEAASSGGWLAKPDGTAEQTSEADVKPVEPEESQISQESSATTDAPSHISHASDHSEHLDSLPNPPGRSNVTETAEMAEMAEMAETAETAETQDELGTAARADAEAEGLEGKEGSSEAKEATEDGEVLLGPYFSVAVDVWMGITRSRGVQLLWQNLLERLS